MHHFKAEQLLPIDIEEAWNFFSSPYNLSKITPPELDFKILSSLQEKEIVEGMKIEYRVKPLWGISVHWKTEIANVENQKHFTDIQTHGPYKMWEHTHTFSKVDGGVLMNDVVKYKLPFGVIGRALNSFLVKRKIEIIFEYSKQILEKLFI